MRRFQPLLLWFALLAGIPACAPEPAALSTPTSGLSTKAPPGLPPRSVGDPFPIPSGYPEDGLDPYTAFHYQKDRSWVVGTGVVERILRDDTKVPRHQRFVVRTYGDHTLLIIHNIDLAPRVPVKKGDRVGFRGEYVWNEQGGVIHFTHRKGRGRDRDGGGWIVRDGQGYR